MGRKNGSDDAGEGQCLHSSFGLEMFMQGSRDLFGMSNSITRTNDWHKPGRWHPKTPAYMDSAAMERGRPRPRWADVPRTAPGTRPSPLPVPSVSGRGVTI